MQGQYLSNFTSSEQWTQNSITNALVLPSVSFHFQIKQKMEVEGERKRESWRGDKNTTIHLVQKIQAIIRHRPINQAILNKENNSSSQSGPRGPDTQASRFLFPILFCVIVVQSFKEYYGLRRATRYLAKQTSEEKMIWVEIYHLFETIYSKMSVVWLYRPMHRPLIFTVEKINNINNKVCMETLSKESENQKKPG